MLQGTIELKDFEIKMEAQGVDKVIIKEFNGVNVKDGTLDIQFRWVGKGTTSSPTRGTYGPLISAIDVESGKYLFLFCMKNLVHLHEI